MLVSSTESYATTNRENKFYAYTSSNVSNKTFESDVKTIDFNFNTVKTTATTDVKVKLVNKTIDKSKLFVKTSKTRNSTSVHKQPPSRTKTNNSVKYRSSLFLLLFVIPLSL